MAGNSQRPAVVIPAGGGAARLRPVVHLCHARRAVPHAGRDAARAGRVGRQWAPRRAACLLVSGLRRVAGQPRRHGQSGGRGHGDRRRRPRGGILDVCHRPARGLERHCRVDTRPALQTTRRRLLHRRPGLLHGARTGTPLDGRALRRADLRDLRFRLQLRAEQHDLRGVGGSLRSRPPLDGRRADAADPGRDLRRYPPHRAREQPRRARHGAGVCRPGAGRRALQPRTAARGARTHRRQRLRLGAGLRRHGRRGADAGDQAGMVPHRGRQGLGAERRRHGACLGG